MPVHLQFQQQRHGCLTVSLLAAQRYFCLVLQLDRKFHGHAVGNLGLNRGLGSADTGLIARLHAESLREHGIVRNIPLILGAYADDGFFEVIGGGARTADTATDCVVPVHGGVFTQQILSPVDREVRLTVVAAEAIVFMGGAGKNKGIR